LRGTACNSKREKLFSWGKKERWEPGLPGRGGEKCGERGKKEKVPEGRFSPPSYESSLKGRRWTNCAPEGKKKEKFRGRPFYGDEEGGTGQPY